METTAPGSGLLGSLRGFVDGILGSVHDRLQLLSVELQEEKSRFIQILIWLVAVATLGFLAAIFSSLVLVLIFWETARLTVVIVLATVYVGGFIAVVMGFKRYLARQTKPFAATLGELQQDRECIREEN
jgi:uncharacterized membrane protein YqjE